MNVAQAFTAAAEKHADKTALFYGEAEFTYATLLSHTRWLAVKLAAEFGVQPGDRVGLWLKNCPEFVSAWFGVQESGAVVVPINNFLKPDEVLHLLDDADIKVLLTDSTMGEHTGKLTAARPQLRVWHVEDFAEAPSHFASRLSPLAPRSSDDLAVLIYTSGTTGRSKGAMLSHGNLLHNVESCRQVLEAVDLDRFAVLLPLFHSFMMTVGMLLPLMVGGSMVLVRSLHPPKSVCLELLHRQATILPAVPQFFRTLAHAGAPENFPVRVCLSGGAPLPLEILREFNAKLPNVPLIEGYGLSEASPVVSLSPLRGPWKAGSIGLPVPGVEVSVQDDAGNLLGDNVTGEICVRGGNVMLGYWNQPEETAKAIRNGWLLTGDVGHRASDGYYHITDRKKDMLLVNGINVYPREIEEILYRIPGVKEAAVIGVPDARRGEQPLAFVVPNEGATLDEKSIQHHIREKLADYKVPKRVVFLPALPRNATGKVLKTALREMPV